MDYDFEREMGIEQHREAEMASSEFSTTERCPECDALAIRIVTHHFNETWGEYTLSYDAPLLECAECGFSYTDYRKEDAQLAAINAAVPPVVWRKVKAALRQKENNQ